MYRYSVDNAVTYTPADLILFRHSPFAAWMERLTLENPDHGIPSDVHGEAPRDDTRPQDDIVNTLRAEGRDVVLVDWDQEEPRRRADTLDAMRAGADFVVNGLLALGTLCGSANMLMRTPGYSDLGDFLYIPCDTQGRADLDSAFRLSFLADLLHSLQGQLPPQLLQIRGDADVVPLQTEDHIYYYLAVKRRFMAAMNNFRKHRMPDPAESSHFGRWSECASEVLRQRAQSAESRLEEKLVEASDVDSGEQEELQAAEGTLVEQAVGAAKDAQKQFDELARLSGDKSESRVEEILTGGPLESVLQHCRTTDLVVIGQTNPDTPEPMRELLIETVLFESGVPVLLVPYIGVSDYTPNNVLIAWDGSSTAPRAIHAALPMLDKSDKITVLVVEKKKTEGTGGQPGAEIATYLARHGLDVTIDVVTNPQTGIADTLLNYVSDHGNDLVVMGGYGHSRMREFLFGGATRERTHRRGRGPPHPRHIDFDRPA